MYLVTVQDVRASVCVEKSAEAAMFDGGPSFFSPGNATRSAAVQRTHAPLLGLHQAGPAAESALQHTSYYMLPNCFAAAGTAQLRGNTCPSLVPKCSASALTNRSRIALAGITSPIMTSYWSYHSSAITTASVVLTAAPCLAPGSPEDHPSPNSITPRSREDDTMTRKPISHDRQPIAHRTAGRRRAHGNPASSVM